MPESYPSRILTVLDVPEVHTFQANFSYNFFTPDEKINDDGSHRAQGASDLEEIERQLSKRHPRFVKFSFLKNLILKTSIVTNYLFDNQLY